VRAFAGRDVRRDGRGAVEALQPQKVAAVVDDRDADCPLVLHRLGLAAAAIRFTSSRVSTVCVSSTVLQPGD
jgi:hypothetical protein